MHTKLRRTKNKFAMYKVVKPYTWRDSNPRSSVPLTETTMPPGQYAKFCFITSILSLLQFLFVIVAGFMIKYGTLIIFETSGQPIPHALSNIYKTRLI
jgi:hypothetical protein